MEGRLADRLPPLTKSDWDEMINRAAFYLVEFDDDEAHDMAERVLRAALGFTEVSVPSCFDKKYDA